MSKLAQKKRNINKNYKTTFWDFDTKEGLEKFVEVVNMSNDNNQSVVAGMALLLEKVSNFENISEVKDFCDDVTDILFHWSLYHHNAKRAFLEDIKTSNADPVVDYIYTIQRARR